MRLRPCLLAALLSAGCSVDTPVPQDAQLACSATAECPGELVCSPAGWCVPSDKLDVNPPDLAGTPEIALRERTAQDLEAGREEFSLSFRTTEALARPAQVVVGVAPPETVECAAVEPLLHACTFTAVAEKHRASEGAVPLEFVLEDEAGNKTRKRGAGALTLDFTPPALALSTVGPEVARRGARVEVFFTAGERLAGPPVVESSAPLDVGGGQFASRFDPEPAGGNNWRLVHVVTSADPQGKVSFSVRLVDASWNPATLPLGETFVDSLLPEATLQVLQPRHAMEGSPVSVRFTTNKPLAAGMTVSLGDLPLECEPGEEDLSWSCDGVTAKVTPSGGAVAEGPTPVLLSAIDQAGNSLVRNLGTVTIDFTPPRVADASFSPETAQAGRVHLRLTASEPLRADGVDAAVVSGDRMLPCRHVEDTAYLFECEAKGGDDGLWGAQVRMTDLAGNPSGLQKPTAALKVDTKAPGVAPLSLSPSHAREGTPVEAAFTVDEELAAPPALDLGGLPLPCEEDGNPRTFRCEGRVALATPSGRSVAQGPTPALLTARDAAGNALAVSLGNVVIDFQAPHLVDATFSPETAPEGTAYLRLAASEELSEVPEVAVTSGDRTLACEHVAGSEHLFACAVRAGDDGRWAAQVFLKDLAGNRSEKQEPSARLRVDTRAPEVESLAASPDRLGPALRQARISFTLADASEAQAKVSVGSVELEGCKKTAGEASVAYECPFALPETGLPEDEDVLWPVSVRTWDAAGNSALANAGVRIDFRAPDLVAGTGAFQVLPGPANPLPVPKSLGPGNGARITFAVDEALSGPPKGEVKGTGQPLCASAPDGNKHTLEIGFHLGERPCDTAALADGPLAIQVTLQDDLGNSRNADLTLSPALLVDAKKPDPPETSEPGRVVHERAPWGTRAGEVARFRVTGGAGAAEKGARVLVLDRDSLKTANELGRGQAGSDGSFGPIELVRTDRVDVYVVAVDEAGNPSDAALVRDGRMTFTLGGKVPGSLSENPTLLATAHDLWPTLAQEPDTAGEPSQEQLKLAAAAGGGALTVKALEQWIDRTPDGNVPSGRKLFASAWDPSRGRLVVYGGQNASGTTLAEVWEYLPAARRWFNATPAGTVGPGPLHGASMAFDPRLGQVVLFGGSDDYGNASVDTWSWDGRAWLRHSPPSSPPARRFAPMVFDGGAERILLHGGARTSSGNHGDTWFYDSLAQRWTEVTVTTGSKPAQYQLMTMAYDSHRGRVLMFGGQTYYQATNAFWEWDGRARTWTDRTSYSAPSARSAPGLCYDAGRKRLVLFGGSGDQSPTAHLNDVWDWDPSTLKWAQRMPAQQPPPRRGMAMACTESGAFVFGGEGLDWAALRDLWRWDGVQGSWKSFDEPSTRPPQTVALAFDAARNELLVHTVNPWELWALDTENGRWTRRSTSPYRSAAALAYDAERKQVVLFGGADGYVARSETFVWNGSSWADATPASGPKPPARVEAAMTWDPTRKKVVLFGGVSYSGEAMNDTWEWDGGAWTDVTSLSPVAPEKRARHRMVWDGNAQGVLLHGTSDASLPEAWLRSSATGAWSRVSSAKTPLSEPIGALIFNPERATTRLLLTAYNRERTIEVWDFAGASATWTQLFPRRPTTATNLPMVLDQRGRAVGHAEGKTWEYDDRAKARPSAVWTVPWSASQLPSSAATGLTLRAVAGGTGGRAGAKGAVPGTELRVWNAAGASWLAQAALNEAPASAPDELTYELEGAGALAPLFRGYDAALSFALAPGAPTGGLEGSGELALDYLELEVRYRR